MRRIVWVFFLFIGSFSFANPGTADPVSNIVEEIIETVGLKANFKLRPAQVPNAIAVTYNGDRFVLYNPVFLRSLTEATGNKWAAVSVLAHEIGHHLNGHTLDGFGSQPGKELEADEFSGFVLRRMGASLDQAQAAMKLAGNRKSSSTHPPQSDRLFAIAKGWNAADPSLGNAIVFSQPKKQPADEMSQSDQAILNPKYVWKKVDFPGDRSANYYITVRSSLVRIENNELTVIGKMAQLEDSNFPYFIRLANSKLLLIGNDGKLINEDGKWIGSLQS